MNPLYYGTNLDILCRKILAETVDLCYINQRAGRLNE
jgi:hypothetical protein